MKIGVVMDPIRAINIKKDSTFEMIWQAQLLGWQVVYFEMSDLSIDNGIALGQARSLTVSQDTESWYNLTDPRQIELGTLDAILMRKDPPFDMEYVYSTYILELAEQQGALIVNSPQALRDCNEKAYCAWFPDVCPETLISRNAAQFRTFLDRHKDIILKPLDGMGVRQFFRVQKTLLNISVILRGPLTKTWAKLCGWRKRYLPEIKQAINAFNGQREPVEYAVARNDPLKVKTRGNLPLAAQGVAQALSCMRTPLTLIALFSPTHLSRSSHC
ncbi:UNVERIFIED_CONTAM: hypothetical protein GTU68_053374 [Idotea baltica]|nr:hypothetical protein [Idotea baltica]